MIHSLASGVLVFLLAAAGCQTDDERTAARAQPPAGTSVSGHLARALLAPSAPGLGAPGSVAWQVESGVRGDGSFVRFAVATTRHPDGSFLRLEVVDLDGAGAMTAAGDWLPPAIPELVTAGLKESTRPQRHRTFYRLNPPGGHFGGELRLFVGKRYVVSALGERLMMETIADQAGRVARRLEATL